MGDIRFSVQIDASTCAAEIKKLEGEFDKLAGTTKKTTEHAGFLHSTFGKLTASMTAAMSVTHLASKAYSGFKGLLEDSINAAAGAEKANVALDAALFTTGRTTAKLGEHFKAYADNLMRTTTLDDEAVKGAQALLLQLTSLDREGIDRATKGAVGLARVFDMGLVPAAELVAKWMEGNTDRIAKYGIHITDTMSLEEKQSAILEQLAVYYKRAESETGTYSGRLEQMKNVYKEVQERMGTAVTQNETFQKTIKYIKDELQFFIDSGQAEKWAANISKTVSGVVKAVETLFAMIKQGPFGGAKAWSEDLVGGMDKWDKVARENVKTITEFRDGLKWIKPSLEDMRVEMEKGEKGWGEYRYRVASMDAEFEKNKKTLGGWMDKAFGLIGIQTEIAKSFDKSTRGNKEFGDGLKKTEKILEALGPYSVFAKIADTFADIQKAGSVTFSFIGVTSKNTAIKLVNDFEWMKNRLKTIAEETAEKWREQFEKFDKHVRPTMQGLDETFNLFSMNRTTQIENEYLKRREAIEKSTMDEEQKNKAFQKLDEEYEVERRRAKRAAFISQKAIETGESIMATARAFTQALPNIPLAILVAALGAAKTALIITQPVPLKTGAIFERPTLLPAITGKTYLAGESGREIVATPENIRKALFGNRGFSRVIHIHVPVYIGAQKIKEQVVEIVERTSVEGTLKIAAKAIRE